MTYESLLMFLCMTYYILYIYCIQYTHYNYYVFLGMFLNKFQTTNEKWIIHKFNKIKSELEFTAMNDGTSDDEKKSHKFALL